MAPNLLAQLQQASGLKYAIVPLIDNQPVMAVPIMATLT